MSLLYPPYGPGEQWKMEISTSQGLIGINGFPNGVNGLNPKFGIHDNTSHGMCPENDCDILGAFYNNTCVGWSYLPLVDGKYWLSVNLDDDRMNYPAPASIGSPVVTFNYYHAEEQKVYYNISGIVPKMWDMISTDLTITGDGDFQSRDVAGNLFPLGPMVCNSSDPKYFNFQAIGGGGDINLCKKYGDVNLDNNIDVVDIVQMVNHITGQSEFSLNQSLLAADVNLDGEINIVDVVIIINNILNLTSEEQDQFLEIINEQNGE
jgi:hypothetical protein